MCLVLHIWSLVATYLACACHGRRLNVLHELPHKGSQDSEVDITARSRELHGVAQANLSLQARPNLKEPLTRSLLAFNQAFTPKLEPKRSSGGHSDSTPLKRLSGQRTVSPAVTMKPKPESVSLMDALESSISHESESQQESVGGWRRRLRFWRSWRRWLTRLADRLLPARSPPSLPAATYFDEYNQLYYHRGMLQDHKRMEAYHKAILQNAEAHFRGKVVLDVGAGTGVLSLWAAQAGAAKVYAVEATPVAAFAKTLVKSHGFEGTVEVLQGKMEEIELPEQVDVIVSEWMGYFLLREVMVKSVLYARDRWLKPTGVMYPSHCRLLLAALDEPGFSESRAVNMKDEMNNWDYLTSELSSRYSLDFGALREAYEQENVDYYYRHAWQSAVGANAKVAAPQVLLSADMHTTSMEELFGWRRSVQLDAPLSSNGSYSPKPLETVCGWFDVQFCGREELRRAGETSSNNVTCVELNTSPFAPRTHWTHTTFVLDPPLAAPYKLTIGVDQSQRSQHDLNVSMAYQTSRGAEVSAHYAITESIRSQARVLAPAPAPLPTPAPAPAKAPAPDLTSTAALNSLGNTTMAAVPPSS
mmetsp:Transcript_75353/g.143429  ORF Transcript_75353/g.143429 Transcript_75353/m.143429 type:complete len:588 (+) Transcript_75353:47-1810(+)